MLLPSIAPAGSCENTALYKYCGDHVPASKLPLRFTYAAAGAPSITCEPGAICSLPALITDAMTQWNAAFPGSTFCSPLCLGSSGANTIGWTTLPGTYVGLTTITYSAPHVIARVSIQLNSARSWRSAGSTGIATGSASMVTAGNPSLGDWLDVETVVLHELGHALGLEHPGNDPTDPHAKPWPYDLTDSASYQQVMYGWTFAGVVKRVLREGDIAGAHRAAYDSYFGSRGAQGGAPVDRVIP